jgi:hypothetical protein
LVSPSNEVSFVSDLAILPSIRFFDVHQLVALMTGYFDSRIRFWPTGGASAAGESFEPHIRVRPRSIAPDTEGCEHRLWIVRNRVISSWHISSPYSSQYPGCQTPISRHKLQCVEEIGVICDGLSFEAGGGVDFEDIGFTFLCYIDYIDGTEV